MAYSNTITTPSTATATATAVTPGDVAGPGAHVRIEDLWYRYPGRDVASWTLQGIDLVLGAGELVGLLGPSGCGKTTLLRLIAGFERPGRGRISIGGQQVAGPDRLLPPERRGVGMVFQDDALFPHLDAWRNACFGLRRGQDTARVAWLLDLLGLGGLERRYPHELSGGQRQRLAMARALAPSPSVVLLDEPFSNLDVEVRLRLRSELPAVLARCGASGLMVTHDPEEALAICDRVGVLRDGVLHQCAPPRQLVDQPATAFVGQFVLQSNLLPARWRGRRLQTALGELEPLSGGDDGSGASEAIEVMVRPQALEFLPDEDGSAWITGREFLGREWLYQVQLGEQRLRWRAPLEADHPHGRRGRLRFRSGESALLFPGGRPLVTLPPGRNAGGLSSLP
ncbi:ABC transporter ATP-binding protein [Cyanobium gracile]|nr:ABC transporter ATP-binding protein [Cyanobium gracile]